MAIPAHVRQFSSVKNRSLSQTKGNSEFEKKTHFIHVRPADQVDIVVLGIHGDNNDEDVADTAFFVALNPRAAAQLAATIEDVLVNDLNFGFDKIRRETLSRLNKKNSEPETQEVAQLSE